MQGYDAWLERPYVEVAADEDVFEKWCEENNVGMSDEGAYDRFIEYREDANEDAMMAAAEAKWEAMNDR